MKRKIYITLIVILLALVAGTSIALWLGHNKVDKATTQPSSSEPQGEQTKEEAQAAIVDPCTIFEVADIEKIFGMQFETGFAKEKGQTKDKKPITECEYRQINDGTEEGLKSAYSLLIVVENFNSSESAKSQIESERTDANKNQISTEDVKDVGDLAYFVSSKSAKNSQQAMYILKGSQIIRISITKLSGIDQGQEKKHLQELANLEF